MVKKTLSSLAILAVIALGISSSYAENSSDIPPTTPMPMQQQLHHGAGANNQPMHMTGGMMNGTMMQAGMAMNCMSMANMTPQKDANPSDAKLTPNALSSQNL